MLLKYLDIRKPAYNIAWYLADLKKENHSQKNVYYYSAQIVLASLIKISVIIFVSLILNIVKEIIIFLAVFALIRSFSGGFHADTYIKCLVYTLLIGLTTVYLSKVLVYANYINYFYVIIFTIVIYITAKYAPVDSPNKPIISDKHRKSLKIKAITINIICFFTALLVLNNVLYSNIIVISLFFESITLTSWFSKVALHIEKYCAKICTLK